jgi:transcriptional regulator with XRE-family HTH domain
VNTNKVNQSSKNIGMSERQSAKDLMKTANITQEELARRLGVSQSRVSQMLDPKADPKLSSLYRVADAIGVDILTLAQTYTVSQERAMRLVDQDPWE